MPTAPNDPLLRAAYDPEQFRAQGHALVDQLADYLAAAARGDGMPVLPWREPRELADAWPSELPARPTGDLNALLARVVREANHLHHPRYVGHQVTAPLPAAALCELTAALLNNSMAVYEMGPGGTAMERAVIQWMARSLGWPDGAEGVLTSGGSIGNLTALLAARRARAGFDAWGEGDSAGPPLAVLTSEQTHYSVRRAVQIMGWGHEGVVAVPTDARFRMRADALPDALRAAERAGRRVIAVVASACSTATGAFDPIEPAADFCARHGLWLHVDGAHGASAAISARHGHLLRGIERADSVVWDAHKMLLMPALVTAVLFRDGAGSYETFAQRAAYLFEGKDPREEWFNVGVRTVECTKRMMCLKLYATLSAYGTEMFGEYVSRSFELASGFASLVRAAGDFELAIEPECNIVCFRYVPPGVSDLDALQSRVRRRLMESGEYYIVQTTLPAGVFLRITIINPRTGEGELAALLEAIRRAAAAGG